MSRGRLPIMAVAAICVLFALAIPGIIADDELELPTKHTTTAKDMESALSTANSSPDLDNYLAVVAKHRELLRSIMILMSTNDEFQKQIKGRTDVSELFGGTGLHTINADVRRFKEDYLNNKLFSARMEREFKAFYDDGKEKYLNEVIKILTNGEFDEELDEKK